MGAARRPDRSATRTGASAAHPSASWLAARARNALARPGRIVVPGTLVFLGVSGALMALPSPRPAARPAAAGPDTTAAWQAVQSASAALAAAETALAGARAAAYAAAAARARDSGRVRAPTAPPDSIALRIAVLDALLARAAAAPIAPSYRVLAAADEVRADPAVRALLDSLDRIEAERARRAAAGGPDRAFAEATARVTAVGAGIVARVAAARDSLKAAHAPPTEPPIAADSAPPMPDTVAAQAERDRAREALADATAALALARAARAAGAPSGQPSSGRDPFALLAAAALLGAAGGFAASLGAEVRRPTIADAREAEAVAAARVVAEVEGDRPPMPAGEGARSLDPYQALALRLAAADDPVRELVVLSPDPAVAAVATARLAAACAIEGAPTLVLDGDPQRALLSRVYRTRTDPGFTDVLAGVSVWREVSLPVTRVQGSDVELVPAGAPRRGVPDDATLAVAREEFSEFAARFSQVLATSPPRVEEGSAALLWLSARVMLCARTGGTPLASLKAAASAVRSAGWPLWGVLLWRGEQPILTL